MNSGFKNPLTQIGLKQQLILVFLVLVVPLFILNSYGNYRADQILKRNVTNAYIELNNQNFRLISRDIESINKVASTVFQHPLVQQLNPAENNTMPERVKNYEKLENLLNSYSDETGQHEPLYYSLFVYDPLNSYSFAPYYPESKKAGVYFFLEREKPEWFEEAVAKKGNGYLRLIEHLSPPAQGQKKSADPCLRPGDQQHRQGWNDRRAGRLERGGADRGIAANRIDSGRRALLHRLERSDFDGGAAGGSRTCLTAFAARGGPGA
ncbi:hypothetical protein HMSSN036_37610 [Paenibacillus macerans]|nr:hypothetical protein HMSSN036_37610 [Paenibacillus macerans]